MPEVTSRKTLGGLAAVRLTEFARACKAATRAVSLYPAAHPAVDASLDRLVQIAGRAIQSGPLTLTILPDTLLVEGAALERPDAAIGELAMLLHEHLVGELTVVSAADTASWRSFLHLLGQSPMDVQAQGGLVRLWAGGGGEHVRLRELDYTEVLRERGDGMAAASWDAIVEHCLQDDSVPLDDASIAALLDVAEKTEGLQALIERIEREAAEGGPHVQAEAVARLLRFIADAVAERQPERLDQVLATMAQVAGRLSPETLMGVLARRVRTADDAPPDIVSQVIAHMSDDTISSFVAQSMVERRGATERLAEAFQALVPEDARRLSVLGLVREQVAGALGEEDDFPKLWQQATDMLLSYRDEPYVPETYARELSRARVQATEVERIADDPPEVIADWLASISDASVRGLDLQLLLDLLRVEHDAGQWDVVVNFVAAHVEDLVLLGDFDAAEPLVQALMKEAGPEGRPTHRASAAHAADRLVRGQLMTYAVGHLRTIDDAGFTRVRALCLALGTSVIRPLAEALTIEERGRAFRRLTDLLVAFGPAGREAFEQLRSSPNPAVRRTAIHLLREYGGHEALPELASLLNDADVNIQREAIRAIALIGSPDAYEVLHTALVSGSTALSETIVSALGSMRDERAVPLFCHMVRSDEYRRTMRRAYLTAIEGLGGVGGTEAIVALCEALKRGEWYAPFRTAALRRAAAVALRRIGSHEALAALQQAAERGSRGVRAAAREQLAILSERRRDEAA